MFCRLARAVEAAYRKVAFGRETNVDFFGAIFGLSF